MQVRMKEQSSKGNKIQCHIDNEEPVKDEFHCLSTPRKQCPFHLQQPIFTLVNG